MAQSTGFLGGTFNPIHNGHLLLAEEARAQFELDEVLFVPNHTPPHRQENNDWLLDGQTRFLMTVLATLHNPAFRVSGIELARGGVSYTVDTAEALRKERPSDRLYFICGADSLTEHHWHRFEDLMELLDGVLVSSRSTEQFEKAYDRLKAHSPKTAGKLREIQMPAVDISSSDIRRRLSAGRSIRYLVPEAVDTYISRYRLYAEVRQT